MSDASTTSQLQTDSSYHSTTTFNFNQILLQTLFTSRSTPGLSSFRLFSGLKLVLFLLSLILSLALILPQFAQSIAYSHQDSYQTFFLLQLVSKLLLDLFTGSLMGSHLVSSNNYQTSISQLLLSIVNSKLVGMMSLPWSYRLTYVKIILESHLDNSRWKDESVQNFSNQVIAYYSSYF